MQEQETPRLGIEVILTFLLFSSTNNISFLNLALNHHLKLGKGWAWAGHISANWDEASVLNDEVSDFELNCGLVPPIGSKQEYFVYKTNLNAGIGNAWAGHVRHIELFSVLVNWIESVNKENLGLAPPIGSVKSFKTLF